MVKVTPEYGIAWLGLLYGKKQTSDVILFSWGNIEFNINQLIAKQFKLKHDDTKAKILTDLGFNKKLEFLKENKSLTLSQYKKLKEFQNFRNKLFHGKEPFWFTKSMKQQEQMMKTAMNAVEAIRAALYSKQSKKHD